MPAAVVLDLPHPYATHTLRGTRGQVSQVRELFGSSLTLPGLVEVENCWTGERVVVLRATLVRIYLPEEENSG